MRTIKFGIFGLRRGATFYRNVMMNNGEVVAVCDRDETKLEEAKKHLGGNVAAYTDFDAFLAHPGLEAVFLCNNFQQHTPFAIKALEKNIHVLSEIIANATMAEGVALVRAAEKSKAVYMIAENYPFMIFNLEMKRVVEGGTLGKIMYAEGEYNHPFNPYDAAEMRKYVPFARHWRYLCPRTYYITHSLGPLMFVTGAKPVRVTAMPVYAPLPDDTISGSVRGGDRSAVITCLNDDDSVFKVTGWAEYGAHCNASRFCGERGQIENIRGDFNRLLLRYNAWDKPEGKEEMTEYAAEWNDPDEELIKQAGHEGGDFFTIREFFNAIRENRRPIFDVYFATTMSSVAILAHRSLLERGVPYDVPDFRREEDRVKYENDNLSPFVAPDAPNYIERWSRPFVPSDEAVAEYERRIAKQD